MPKVELRTFSLELKHRPDDDMTGEREELVDSIELTVPRLRNSAMETRWATLSAWNLFNTDYAKENKINQIFLFTASFQELIVRLEMNRFVDEECKTLNPPTNDEHIQWMRSVEKRFIRLYGTKMSEWLRKTRSQPTLNRFNS